jgi:hypothetical protein
LESDTKAVFIDETISDLYIETGEMCLGYIWKQKSKALNNTWNLENAD